MLKDKLLEIFQDVTGHKIQNESSVIFLFGKPETNFDTNEKFWNMWTIAAVNKKFDGPLGSYNGLTDVHLAHYFSRPSRQSHLKAAKLITEDGFIVPEKNVKVELYLHEKKKKLYDILARSILQNAILKEGSWNKKLCNYLEDISKMAAVDKARRTIRKKSSKVASELFHDHPVSSNFSFEDTIPKSASKFLSDKIFKPSNSAPVTCFCFANDGQQKVTKRSVSAKMHSPYGIPLVLSGTYKEHSHSPFDYEKTLKQKKRKRRKFNNSVGNSNVLDKKNLLDHQILNVSIPRQTLKFSQCKITLFYHGHLLLTNFQKNLSQSILIKQQHCGGMPVVIYKGRISANESISFFSLDHEGYFFSITVFLSDIRELKLSSCCVFRYSPGKHLGGPNGTFSIKKIEGGKPCLKCQYQEFVNNNFKVISQTSEVSAENSEKNISVLDLDDAEDKIIDITPVDIHEPEEMPEEAVGTYDDESLKVVNTANNTEDEIEEILDDLPNQNIKEELSSNENIASQESASSYEEEIKEQEELNHSSSSPNQSEDSEKYVELSKKYHEISIGTSSSEDEGEKKHIITASVHGSPENS